MENDEPASPDPSHDSTQSKRGKRVLHSHITYLNAALVGNDLRLCVCVCERENSHTCETWNKLAHTFSHRYETSGTLKIHPLCDRSGCLCASSPTLTHSACAKSVPREPVKPQLCDFCHFSL